MHSSTCLQGVLRIRVAGCALYCSMDAVTCPHDVAIICAVVVVYCLQYLLLMFISLLIRWWQWRFEYACLLPHALGRDC